MRYIGLGHYSRTGKDTFANYLVEEFTQLGYRAKKLPFAWKLKQICHDLYAWDGLREPEFYDTKEGEPYRDIPLPTIGKTPVEIWVAMGTPAVRECVYMDTWIRYVMDNDHDCDVLIVPDVRFPNEVQAIHDKGGIAGKIVRPGYGPRNTVADQALVGFTGWDFCFGGRGGMDDLREEASVCLKHFMNGEPFDKELTAWHLSQEKL